MLTAHSEVPSACAAPSPTNSAATAGILAIPSPTASTASAGVLVALQMFLFGGHWFQCSKMKEELALLKHHWLAGRFLEAREGGATCPRSPHLWQLWLCSFVRLTNCSLRALHADDGKKTTERPSVRVVNPCRKARLVVPTRTCTVMTAAFRKHQSPRLLRVYHLLSQGTMSFMRIPDGRILLTITTRTHSVMHPHQQCSASFCPRVALHCFPIAPMSGNSSSSWWEGRSGTYHDWHDTRHQILQHPSRPQTSWP